MPIVIVIDANVVLVALVDKGRDGHRARDLLASGAAAPHLLDVEVVSSLRNVVRAQKLSASQAQEAVAGLAGLPLQRVPHGPMVQRIWQLRENLTSYDASYVALAERLQVPLVTSDRRLSRAPGIKCQVQVVRARG